MLSGYGVKYRASILRQNQIKLPDGSWATHVYKKGCLHSMMMMVGTFSTEIQTDHIQDCKKRYSWHQWHFQNRSSRLAMVVQSLHKVELRKQLVKDWRLFFRACGRGTLDEGNGVVFMFISSKAFSPYSNKLSIVCSTTKVANPGHVS